MNTSATINRPDHAALREQLLDAALPQVVFDGWSEASLRMAATDCGIDPALAVALFPRGGVDLALAFHRRGDAAMVERLRGTDLSDLRFRDRIARAVRFRLEAAGDREAVRRAAALFALPQNAAAGSRAMWETADLIWTELGDTSEDLSWYTKRATLVAVYSATLLYWLGDQTQGSAATWEFLDRRIDEVMRFEKVKGSLRQNPLGRALVDGPGWLFDRLRAPVPPAARSRDDLPGRHGSKG